MLCLPCKLDCSVSNTAIKHKTSLTAPLKSLSLKLPDIALRSLQAGRLLGARLGSLLLSFLQRYGYSFNYTLDAVTVRLGGIVLKTSVPAAAPLLDDATKASCLLVEDLNTLRQAQQPYIARTCQQCWWTAVRFNTWC